VSFDKEVSTKFWKSGLHASIAFIIIIIIAAASAAIYYYYQSINLYLPQ